MAEKSAVVLPELIGKFGAQRASPKSDKHRN